MENKELAKETTILFVDDEIDFRNILAFSFGRKGYKVLTASNGKEAFAIIQSQPVDVVVSDIRMPDGDGIELLDHTKERHPGTPIILLVTGFADVTTEEAHNKGAEALFSKPFDLNMLEQVIQTLLTPPDQRWAEAAKEVDTEIKVELRFQNLSSSIEAKVLSIGRGGMFIAFDKGNYPNINDEVSFTIHFDGQQKPLVGNGTIRWIRTQNIADFASGFGIEFTYLDEADRKLVIEYAKAKKLKPYIPNR